MRFYSQEAIFQESCLDFDARTKQGKGSALRNHGTKFRVHVNDIGVLYENSELITV